MNLEVNTDGASRGNPGPAAYGFLIRDKASGQILHSEGQRIGHSTNNIAEYTAVLMALTYIKENLSHKKISQIQVITDSQLIAKQLAGLYKIKNQNLKVIFDLIKVLEFELAQISYKNVPREQNREADKLANQALDNK